MFSLFFFVILKKFKSTGLFMKYGKCFIDLAFIWKKLGTCVLIALLVLHALTGCDTTGKFSGRGKGPWVKRFLLAIEDKRFLSSMCEFEK